MSNLNSVEIPNPPKLAFVMQIRVTIDSPLELGKIHGARKRIIPITGGEFNGPGIRGIVRPGGADWQFTNVNGVLVLYARYTLETETGRLITVENRGFRHGPADLAERIASGEQVPSSEYYFITSPVFETSARELQWLSKHVFIGQAERFVRMVSINVFLVGGQAGSDFLSGDEYRIRSQHAGK